MENITRNVTIRELLSILFHMIEDGAGEEFAVTVVDREHPLTGVSARTIVGATLNPLVGCVLWLDGTEGYKQATPHERFT